MPTYSGSMDAHIIIKRDPNYRWDLTEIIIPENVILANDIYHLLTKLHPQIFRWLCRRFMQYGIDMEAVKKTKFYPGAANDYRNAFRVFGDTIDGTRE